MQREHKNKFALRAISVIVLDCRVAKAPCNDSKVVPEGNHLLCHCEHSEAIFPRFCSNDKAAALPFTMTSTIALPTPPSTLIHSRL